MPAGGVREQAMLRLGLSHRVVNVIDEFHKRLDLRSRGCGKLHLEVGANASGIFAKDDNPVG